MSWLRQFLFRLQAVFRRRGIEAQLEDEIRVHLEMATEANIAEGMSRDEALCAARRQFGGVEQVKESYRDERVLVWLDQLSGDVRLAVRSLGRARGFTFTAVFIVAVCLAANVVIFSMVNAALLRPLPFRDPGRLVVVHNSYPKAGLLGLGVSVPHYLERKREMAVFQEAGCIRYANAILNGAGAPERVAAAEVTPSFLRVLGVNAAVGRTFTDDEGMVGKDKVALLSDGFWRERYNADPSAVGRSIRIQDVPYTIVGVMPAGFRYLSYGTKLWMPLSFSDDDRKESMRHDDGLEMIARLRPGATLAQAQAQLDAVNERARKIDPMADMVRSVGYFSSVADLHADHVRGSRPVLLLLQAGVLFLLLIGVVNLANLFMARATGRAKEYSVRRALGAGRHQLVRALLVEALLLSAAGGAVGLGLGYAVLTVWARVAAGRLPEDVALGLKLDPTVCLAALGLSVALGLLLAAPAIWLMERGNPADSLAVESRGGTTTRSVHRLRHTLIVVQIALAFVLLSATGLLGLSFIRVLDVEPGFRRENLMTGVVSLPWWGAYKKPETRAAAMGRLASSLRSIPGTTSASISQGVPFTWRTNVEGWSIVGSTPASDEFIKEGLFTNLVLGDYFKTLGIPLVEGRFLGDDDVQMKREVCDVDEEFAHRHWPKGGAIGRQLARPRDPNDPHPEIFTIVGVVGTVKQKDLADQQAHGAAYFPAQDLSEFVITVRSMQAPEASAPAIRAAVLRIDPSLELFDMEPMESRVDDSLSTRRTPLVLAGIFAGVSLVLAAVGIYGVLAYSVAQRRREIGVRMALGAQPGQIMGQFLGLGLRLLCLGLPMGLLGAWVAGHALSALLFGVTPVNPAVLSCTAVAMAAAVMPACLVPSRRAANVNPTEALRAE